jgi:hypothetical protein
MIRSTKLILKNISLLLAAVKAVSLISFIQLCKVFHFKVSIKDQMIMVGFDVQTSCGYKEFFLLG